MNRLTASLATITLGLALLGCDDKTPDAKPGTGAGAGVGVGGSSGADPMLKPTVGGDGTTSTRPMAGGGGVGNTGSMTPEGAANSTGANLPGGAHSTTQPSPTP